MPKFLSELGVKNIECRVSDNVNFLNPKEDQQVQKKLFYSLKEDGVGGEPIKKDQFFKILIKRGVRMLKNKFEAELLFSQVFNMDSYLIYAPSMKITFGDIKSVN